MNYEIVALGAGLIASCAYALYLRRQVAGFQKELDRSREVDLRVREGLNRHYENGPSNLNRLTGGKPWIAIPDVLARNMPARWQAVLYGLLTELEEEFPAAPHFDDDVNCIVQCRSAGKFVQLEQNPAPHILQQWRQGYGS